MSKVSFPVSCENDGTLADDHDEYGFTILTLDDDEVDYDDELMFIIDNKKYGISVAVLRRALAFFDAA